MIQRGILLAAIFLIFESGANCMKDIDNFIRDHCGTVCNGESDDCRVCYNEGVDLFDQGSPDSPEIKWDLHYNRGQLELEF